MRTPAQIQKYSLAATNLHRRFVIALVLMSVLPLLYLGYLFNQHVQVSPGEGAWIFAAVVFLLIMAGAGALIVLNVFAVIARFATETKALVEGRLHKVSLPLAEGGEMGDLARSIVGIMDKIRLETDSLQSSKQELEITKAKLLESYAKLEEAIEKVRKVDQMKSDFVANVAHELIHPLATLRGSLDIVLANLAGEDAQKREVLEISRRNMARLIRLVTDILDISRIESGKMPLRLETIGVQDMLREIVVPLEKLFRDKDIEFVTRVASAVTSFQADRDRIIQATMNLLVNAAKYTPPHRRVSLEITGSNGQLRFAVKDNGPGISPEDQAKLFDKFSRVNKEKQEGTGLGLCITKDIVTLHHGKIWVESNEGQGSTFAFVIPIQQGEVAHGG